MITKEKKRLARLYRHTRVRTKVKSSSTRPRLSVFRSLNHIYTQVIDDARGNTLISASSLEPEIKAKTDSKTKREKAELVGTLIAKRALDKKIRQVVFDRGGYKYHGRVKSLAEAARQSGLKF